MISHQLNISCFSRPWQMPIMGLIGGIFLACQPSVKEEVKPNIVYILADDLGYGDLQSYNPASKIPTPHLDRLASQGMRFTDAHAPAAVCTPTRYGILTGRYCWRSRLPKGVLRGYGRALIEPGRNTVADLLQREGYRTGVVGKWHLGLDWVVKNAYQDSLPKEAIQTNEQGMVTEMNSNYLDFSKNPTDGPLNHGFDYSFILPASLDMDPYCFLENDALTAPLSGHTKGNDLNTGYTGAFWREGMLAAGFEMEEVLPRFIEKGLEFIRRSAAADSSFFLYLPLAAPHTPWVPKEDYTGKSQAGSYGDFVYMVDAMVGRVLAALDSLGLTDNTLVFFTSDNGPYWPPRQIDAFKHQAAGDLRGMKADAWEGGHRIPLIVRWPNQIAAASVSDAPVSLTSLMATCAELMNKSLPEDQGEDSHSIWPVLNGRSDTIPGQEAIIQMSSGGYFVVRKENWKLIHGLGSGGFSQPTTIEPTDKIKGQLYDLSTDLLESNNLYASNPDKVQELTGYLEEYRSKGTSRRMESLSN